MTKVFKFEEYQFLYFNNLVELRSDTPTRKNVLDTLTALENEKNIINLDKDKFKNALITPTNAAYSEFREKGNSYKPFDDNIIMYTELSKIDCDKEKTVKKFIENYGIPIGVNSYTQPSKKNKRSEYDIQFNDTTLYCVYKNVETLKLVVSLWLAIKEEKIDELKNTIEKYRNYIILYKEKLDKKSVDILLQAKYLLVELLLHIPSSEEKTFDIVNGKILPVVYFKDLFEIAYFQFRQAIINDVPMKECPKCHHYFEIGLSSKRKFCPPRPGKRYSDCENAFNHQEKRRKNKESENNG